MKIARTIRYLLILYALCLLPTTAAYMMSYREQQAPPPTEILATSMLTATFIFGMILVMFFSAMLFDKLINALFYWADTGKFKWRKL